MGRGSHGFAVPAYQGYEYQIQATVDVAVDLILVRGLAKSVVVEPASGEDLALELSASDPESAISTITFDHQAKNIQVQIKLRQTGHWTNESFRGVLVVADGKTGCQNRERPLEYLQGDSSRLFVLLTNAQINSQLRDFRIAEFGERSRAKALPPKCSRDGAAFAPRIGILDQQTPQLIRQRTREQLHVHAHVPSRYLARCVAALENAVRDRLLDRRPSAWPKEELVDIIRAHSGYPSSNAIDRLVKPANYAALSEHLKDRHALILRGTPGSGKSLVSKGLIYDLQMEGFELIQLDPTQTLNTGPQLDDEHNSLFYLDDPWGNYRLEQHASMWIKELPKILDRASSSKKWLVTSRTGILRDAFGATPPSVVVAAAAELTEGDYDDEGRAQILRRHSEELGPELKDYVARHGDRILEEIKNPYAISMFVRRLQANGAGSDIDDLIKSSKVEFVGNTLAQEVRAAGLEGVRSAAILWLLFMLNRATDDEIANFRDFALAGGGSSDLDPRGLLRKLRNSGWFESREGRVIAHPTQIEGLESLFGDVDLQTGVEDTLRAVLSGLVKGQKVKEAVAVTKTLVSRRLPIPGTVQEAINQFVVERCVTADRTAFADALKDVALLSSGDDPVTLLAKALQTQKSPRRLGFSRWSPPTWNENVRKSVSGSNEARHTAAMFFKHSLCEHTFLDYRYSDLIEFIFTSLKWDLSADCEAGFMEALDYGNADVETLLLGALQSEPPPFDRLLNKSLAALDAVNNVSSEENERYRMADQEELDAAETEYLRDGPPDYFLVPGHAIDFIVGARCKREGYSWILSHPRREDLLGAWKNTISPKTTPTELDAYWRATRPRHKCLAWKGVQQAKALRFRIHLIKDLKSEVLRRYDLDCVLDVLAGLLSATQWKSEFVAAIASLPFDRRLLIALGVKRLHKNDFKSGITPAKIIRGIFSSSEWQSVSSLIGNGTRSKRGNSTPTVKSLKALARSKIPSIALTAIGNLADHNTADPKQLKPYLEHGDLTVRASAAKISGHEAFRSLKAKLRKLLGDEEYRVRLPAMESLAKHATKNDWPSIVAMHEDRSGPIREKCAELIGTYNRREGDTVLIALLNDRRDSNSHSYVFKEGVTGGSHFQVARAAADAIAKLDELSETNFEKLLHFVMAGQAHCQDIVVRHGALQSLIDFGDEGLLPIFVELLHDSHYAPGLTLPGYPVRFAAAWGIVTKLMNSKGARDAFDPGPLLERSLHTDCRLAGPCLLALGMLMPRSSVECGNALPAGCSAVRKAIIFLGQMCVTDEPTKINDVIAPPSELSQLARQIAQNRDLPHSEWPAYLKKHRGIKAWLKTATLDADFGRTAKWALQQTCPNLLSDASSRTQSDKQSE